MKNKNSSPKRIIALLILMFTVTGIMFAAPRSVEQARKAAVAQMKKHGANKSQAHGGTFTAVSPQLVLAKEKQNKDEVYYYVFSAGRDLGYTIVSGDDRLPEIVGYTESGNYDADRLPENLVSFMQAYQDFADNATDAQIEEIRQWKAMAKHAAVAPLMAEKWNQGAPYNNMCPIIKYSATQGDRAVTGCVATAIAQILHHHQCPKKLTSNIPAYAAQTVIYGEYRNEINMPEISTADGTYDWQNMLNVYNGNETQTQNDAVAKLMLHVGCAVKMNYGPKASGASATAEVFTKYFGMDKELVRQVQRSSYNISQWDKMLYDEIAAQRPVYYDGQSTGGGHAFVIHGYDDGLYYVNWGWGGYCDGYFDITILNPHSTSGTGASSSDDGYSMGNGMIIGITPDNGVVDNVANAVFTARNLIVSDLNVQNGNITAKTEITVINFNTTEYTRYVSVGYMDDNGNIHNVATPATITIKAATATGNGYSGYRGSGNCDISFPCTTGNYTLVLIESTDKNTWALCPQYSSTFAPVHLQVKDGKASIITPSTSLTATAELDTESGGYAGMNNTINITVTNSGDKEYYDKVGVRVGTENTMPTNDTYATGITAPANGSTTFNFAYTPQTAGTYNFWILDVSGKEIGKSSITFQASSAPVLSFVSIKCSNASGEKVYADFQDNKVEMDKVNDTKAEFTFEIKNDGGYYEGQFYIVETYSWEFDIKTLKIPANTTTPFTFTVEGNVGSPVGLMLQSASEAVTIAGLTKTNNHTIQGRNSYYPLTNKEICYLAGIPENTQTMAITYSVTDTDVDRINTMLKENTQITSIDLTGSTSVKTTKDIVTGNPNTLLYINDGVQIGNTENVIVKKGDTYTCENLQLIDAMPFETLHTFTAVQATHKRADANGWCSVYLPFAISNIPEGITVEKFVSADTQNKTVTFEKVTSMEAYTPYIYNKNGENTFSNSNVTIAKEQGTTDGMEFIGTLTGIDAPNIKGYYILKSDGTGFGIATETAKALPFRAMIKVNGANGAPTLKAIHNGDNGTTGINEFDASAGNGESIYNLRGEKISTPTKGIYIKNGKKYILK